MRRRANRVNPGAPRAAAVTSGGGNRRRPLERPCGKAATVLPSNDEMTTQQAADCLNVFRPHLIKLLEKGRVPFRVVGTHRRVRFVDLQRYREEDDARRRAILDQLAAEGQENGFDY